MRTRRVADCLEHQFGRRPVIYYTNGHEHWLWDDADRAQELGLFVRRMVGLDRAAAQEAFAGLLEGGGLTETQVRFIGLIVNELTANGIMEPSRLFESPFTDVASTGPGALFEPADVTSIVSILNDVKGHAMPSVTA